MARGRSQVEMTLDEINERFKDEWVLVEETAVDENDTPLRGIVLAHTPNRKHINKALAKEPRPSQLPKDERHRYSIFIAHPRLTYEEWCALIDRVNEMDERDIPCLSPL